MEIFKVLPDGRTVTREVSEDEFVNGGWMQQGWASDTLAGVSTTDYHLMDQAFNNHFKNVPTSELVKYPTQITALKSLPGGKWAERKMTYGEYMQGGWRQQGWGLKAKKNQFRYPATRSARQEALRKLKEQKWWYPRRSYSQAKALQRWTFVRTIPQEEKERQIEQLRDFDYIPNPLMRRYSERLKSYAARKTNQFRKLGSMPRDARLIWWRTQRQLLDVDGHPMPDPVVTRAQARAAERPKRSHGESSSAYGWRMTDHVMHWNRNKYPNSWRKWLDEGMP